jgi:holo-[acyl-carrier protein] synthase
MIYGVGVDLVDIDRIKRLLEKNESKFLSRCFTNHEIEYSKNFSDPSKSLAARFAGKEAVMKSLGYGWRQLSWKDIEITGGGRPTVKLYNKASRKISEKSIDSVHISISHEENKAIAFAVSEKK